MEEKKKNDPRIVVSETSPRVVKRGRVNVVGGLHKGRTFSPETE